MEDIKTKTLEKLTLAELHAGYHAWKEEAAKLWAEKEALSKPLRDRWYLTHETAEEISREIVRRCMKGESL